MTALTAWGAQEREVVRVTGIVRLVGNEPFTELVISDGDKSWFVAQEDRQKLENLQHRTVTIEGEETVVERTLVNGVSAGERRTLSKIRIVSVED